MFHGSEKWPVVGIVKGGGYPPPAKPAFRRPLRPYTPYSYLGPLYPYQPPRSSAPLALDHPARRRTVRPLIRTVLTDTTPRPSPDVPRRAAGRKRAGVSSRSSVPSIAKWGIPLDAPPLPHRSIVCAKRAIRREVLFATQGTGAGSRSPRIRTLDSKTRC